MDGEFPTTCRHSICQPCGFELVDQPQGQWKCPLCRMDNSSWLSQQFIFIPSRGSSKDVVRGIALNALVEIGPNPEPLLIASEAHLRRHLATDSTDSPVSTPHAARSVIR